MTRHRRILVLIAVALPVVALGALRAQGTSAVPGSQATASDTATLASKVLANGLEVIVLEDHSVPLVTVEMAVRNGSFTESPDMSGLAHVYEHMFFKTNDAVKSGAAYLNDIGQLGITYNGTTKEELSEYYLTTTTANLPVAARYLRDAARGPAFDEAELDREREVVIGEIDRKDSNPYAAISDTVTHRLFFKYPTLKLPMGTRGTVRAVTSAMLRVVQSRYYVPNNCAVIFGGDISPQAAFLLAGDLFGDWARRPVDPFTEFPLVQHPPLPKSEGVIVTEPVNNVIIELAWQGPSIGKDTPATYTADVFSYILQQPGSHFQRTLVDAGLADGVDLGYYTQRTVGPITMIMQTAPARARAAARAVFDEMAHFNDPAYFTDAELANAKAQLEAQDIYARETSVEYVHTVAFWWSSTGLEYLRGYLRQLRAVSRDDIRRYVTTYLQGKPSVGVALLSAEGLTASGLTIDDLTGVRK